MKPESQEILEEFSFYFSRPTFVQVDITNSCQLDCKYCYNKANNFLNNTELSDTQLLYVIGKIVTQLKPIHVVFSGGEPLLRETILIKCMKRLVENQIDVSLNTNAMSLNKRILEEFKHIGINSININVESLNKDEHDNIRWKSGCFEKLLQHLALTKKILGSDKITIRTVVNNRNVSDLEKIAYFVKEHEFKCFHLLDMIPTTNNDKNLLLDKNSWLKFYKIYKRILKLNIKVRPNHAILFLSKSIKDIPLTFCMAGRLQMIICANGMIVPCNYFKDKMYVCGNALKDDLFSIWKDSKVMNKFRYSLSGYEYCNNCSNLKTCAGGCKAMSLGVFGKAFYPDPYCIEYKL